MPEFTREQFAAVCAALDLDPETTLSINASPGWLRVVHADQAVTSVPVSAPAPDPITE